MRTRLLEALTDVQFYRRELPWSEKPTIYGVAFPEPPLEAFQYVRQRTVQTIARTDTSPWDEEWEPVKRAAVPSEVHAQLMGALDELLASPGQSIVYRTSAR